ncbi:MAG: T9SS type A sorting domain-containing protein [Bacteroidales bacterium]|nr:T9SS type A sorting domain-containing protein [Bacteroidales bacterium]
MKPSIISTLLIACFLIITTGVNAQTITIGTGTNENSVPINPYYGYSYSQSIYDQSEINVIADIDKISFYFNGNSSFTDNPVEIFLGHTSKNIFSGGSDWIDIASLTLVYSGPVTTTSTAGWIEIDITDFTYNNTDNLLVAVCEKQSGFHSSSDDYYATACSNDKCIYKTQDSPEIDPASPPLGSVQSFRPNIRMEMIGSTPMSYLSATCTQNNTEGVYPGTADVEIIGIEVETTGSSSPLQIDSFDLNMNGSDDPLNDVDNVAIYYTSNASVFSTGNLYGSVAPSTGNINISGNQTLGSGINYFWIVYNIAAGATTENIVDAECTQINFSGPTTSQTPTISDPFGSTEIIPVPTVYQMNNTNLNTCYGAFTDSGGESSDYSSNESYVKTICSNDGTNLRFKFTSFDVQNTWDQLRIRDGANDTCLIIGTYSTVVPDIIISSGSCLTFEFTSDDITEQPGWYAEFECFDSGSCGANPNASDLCANAPLLYSMDGICGTTGSYNATDLSGTNLQSEFCSGVNFIDNNSWLKFQASQTSVELAIVYNCNNSGLEAAILETADCTTFTQKACYDPFYNSAPGVFKVDNLVVGNFYYLMLDQFSDAGCAFQINGLSGVVLPVELSYFQANFENHEVTIQWKTLSEKNNAFFTLERSENGMDFQPVNNQEGAVNCNYTIQYEYIDIDIKQDHYYYRLKQTDFDGGFSYSGVIYVECDSDRNNIAKCYPNPAADILNIEFDLPTENTYKYEITNCIAQCCQSGELNAGKSVFKIQLNAKIKPGLYILSLTGKNYEKKMRLIIK